jgi:hypothetical protein
VFDLQNIRITYTPGGGNPRDLVKAPDAGCVGGQWYVSQVDSNGNPAELQLCPDTCAAVQGDNDAQINVTFTCLNIQ